MYGLKNKTIKHSKKNHFKMYGLKNKIINHSKKNHPKPKASKKNLVVVTKNKDGSLTKTFRKQDPIHKTLLQTKFTEYPNGYSIMAESKAPNSYRMIQKEYRSSIFI
jgi:hypothetical protein